MQDIDSMLSRLNEKIGAEVSGMRHDVDTIQNLAEKLRSLELSLDDQKAQIAGREQELEAQRARHVEELSAERERYARLEDSTIARSVYDEMLQQYRGALEQQEQEQQKTLRKLDQKS